MQTTAPLTAFTWDRQVASCYSFYRIPYEDIVAGLASDSVVMSRPHILPAYLSLDPWGASGGSPGGPQGGATQYRPKLRAHRFLQLTSSPRQWNTPYVLLSSYSRDWTK